MKSPKRISEESDVTLFNEYSRQNPVFPSYKELIFFTFMAILYYSNYARWAFWGILIIFIIGFLFHIFDNTVPYFKVLKEELKRRKY